MQYLIDADVLIRASLDYYPIDRIPQFWDWILKKAGEGHIKMTRENHGEVLGHDDAVKRWINQQEVKDLLIFDEEVDFDLLKRVFDVGYAADLTDDELAKIGKDPFPIAYALKDVNNRCVVTKERSAPSKERANRKIPDVCRSLGVRCISDFVLYEELDFRIP